MSFSRRAFVQSGSLCMTQLALTKRGWSRASTDTKPIGRVVLPINQRWRFSRTFEPGMVERTYDDSALQLVTLPHTNVELPWHGFDHSYLFTGVTCTCQEDSGDDERSFDLKE
jgi:beta-galactosidase